MGSGPESESPIKASVRCSYTSGQPNEVAQVFHGTSYLAQGRVGLQFGRSPFVVGVLVARHPADGLAFSSVYKGTSWVSRGSL